MKQILVVDDNKLIAEGLALRLGLLMKDARILTARDGREAMEVLTSEPVDLLVTDLQMPVIDGYDLIAYCRKNMPRVQLCAMSGALTPGLERQLSALGVTVSFDKPFDFDKVAERIRDEFVARQGLFGGIA
jgi:CheY-like chemotaxis protein